MIRLYRFIAVIFILIIQINIIPNFTLELFEPNLLLALTILIAIFHGVEAGCLTGFIAGLISDVNSEFILGVQALSWTQIAFAAAFLREKLMIDNYFIQSVLVGLGCIAAGILQSIIYGLSTLDIPIFSLLTASFFHAITTSLLTYPIVRLLEYLKWAPKTKRR